MASTACRGGTEKLIGKVQLGRSQGLHGELEMTSPVGYLHFPLPCSHSSKVELNQGAGSKLPTRLCIFLEKKGHESEVFPFQLMPSSREQPSFTEPPET